MTRQEFLGELKKGLSGLPQEETEERLGFYSEMIDDRMEEGLTEEEAVAQVGPVEDIAAQIISEIPLTKIVKEKVKPKRALKAWEIVLLILGFPLWFSLLIAAASVIFSLYITLWSLIISLWAILISVAAGSLGGIAGGILFAVQGHGLTGVAAIGAALLCIGLTIFLFFGCKAATIGAVRLTKKIALWIKSLFIGKENDHA